MTVMQMIVVKYATKAHNYINNLNGTNKIGIRVTSPSIIVVYINILILVTVSNIFNVEISQML